MHSDLLPPATTRIEHALDLVGARRLLGIDAPVDTLLDPASIPAPLLPWLGWGLSIDRWSAAWSEAQKRAACAAAIDEQRRKGTPASVKAVLASYDPLLQLVEWFQRAPEGEPHTFEIRLPLYDGRTPAARAQLIDDVIRDIAMVKPVRSWFRFVQLIDLMQRLRAVAAVRPVTFARFTGPALPGGPAPAAGRLLNEDGGRHLLEDGGDHLQEAA